MTRRSKTAHLSSINRRLHLRVRDIHTHIFSSKHFKKPKKHCLRRKIKVEAQTPSSVKIKTEA